MDTKVVLMFFGVILLLAAIFFFFKSFTGHEQRMQEEQRARIELERKKLEEERARGTQPLTPEEIERRRKLAEAKQKADVERRKVMEATRKEAEKQRLAAQIEAEKQRAEAEKQRAEELRLAEELRQKQAVEAKKKAEEESQAQRKEVLASCEEALSSTDRASKAVRAAVIESEDAVRDIDTQVRAAKTRIDVMTRQVEIKQRLAQSIPQEMRWMCPNLMCGKVRPTVSTTAHACPFCKTGLQQKDMNEKRRQGASDDLTKTQQKLALEQERARNISPGNSQRELEKYKAQQTTVENVRNELLATKQSAEGEAPNIPLLKQQLARSKAVIDGVLASLPEDLVRIAQAAPASNEPAEDAQPRKIYQMKDGRTLEVVSEMVAGDDVILKTADGKMVNVKKSDIESTKKASP